jgi:hypothetical protein
MLKRAAAHRGAAFLEILQNCNVYNDLAWNVIYERESKAAHELRLQHGKPLLFGPADDRKAVVMDGVKPKVVSAKDVPESAASAGSPADDRPAKEGPSLLQYWGRWMQKAEPGRKARSESGAPE